MARHGIYRICGFFCLTALAAAGLHLLIGLGLRNVSTSSMGTFNRAMQGRVNADIVISGSSRACAHYDPEIIQKMTGNKTFNCGRNGSRTDVQLAVLQAYLRQNRKPKIVVQNLDMHSLLLTPQDEVYLPSEYVPYLHYAELYQCLLRINPRARMWKYVPLYGYIVDDMSLTWTLGVRRLFGWNPTEDHYNGYAPSDFVWTDAFDRFKAKHPYGVRYDVEPDAVRVMENLIVTCQSNQIAVVLVYSPQYYEMLNLVTNRAEVFGKFSEIADRHNVPFWDYSASSYSFSRSLFVNSTHLNRKGAEAFSLDLSARLVQWNGKIGHQSRQPDQFRITMQTP